MARPQSPRSSAPTPPPRKTVEVIDPRWLLRAGTIVLLAALACAYLTLCGLFYFGQWRLVLAPVAKSLQTHSTAALPIQSDRIAADHAGHADLLRWTVPSDSAANPTVLLLHDGIGNLDDAAPLVELLHSAELNVVAFDYRGFGQSEGPHPTQTSMEEDSDRAFAVLARSVPPGRIILVGQGLGAALAVRLATRHPDVAAIILQQPQGDVAALVAQDPRTRMIPVRLLMRETFPLQAPLARLAVPKLIVTNVERPSSLNARLAADPKMTVELPASDTAAYLRSLRRFLDTYVASPMPSLR